jgi:cysteine desulfurase/selenocysteine lyase
LGAALLREIPGVRLLGNPRERVAALPFALEGVHPHDLATLLDLEGIAVRAGHLCAQPLLRRMGVPATVRASLALYSRRSDLEALAAAVRKARKTFA